MIERLGWTLVHFLWQGALIAVFYAAARLRWGSPSGRYLLACAALLAMVAAPLVTFGLLCRPEWNQPVAPLGPGAAHASGAGAAIVVSMAWIPAGLGRESVLSWVVLLWLAGASAFWARLMGGWFVATRLRSKWVRPAQQEWQRILDQIGGRIGLSRPVRLLVSGRVHVPTVVGWLRPVVLVPVAALAGLPPEHVEGLLAHELAHIRRHDYLVNILQSIAEALLFYHPAVWWLSGHIRTERELCCDDIAVSVSGDVLTYASALAELESNRPVHLNPALAADGGSLADRIARLLGQSRPPARTLPGPGVIASAVLLVVTAWGVFGQSANRPRFEVASIKPNTSPSVGTGRFRPPVGGRLTTENMVLAFLIQMAYDFKPYQVEGGPTWIKSARYDIVAKAEGNASENQMKLMMQSLLEDRFKLKVHRETRQFPVYELTVAKGGLKHQKAEADTCVAFDPSRPPPPPPPGQAPFIPCGRVIFMIGGSFVRINGAKVSTAELAERLAFLLGRNVIDRTGFTGTLEVHLQAAMDDSLAGVPLFTPGGGPTPAADSADPTIFTALTEQLGLKLESTKGPVDVLVIDHVERPTEN
jgi:uncharacterized protein (TIGR03435 family)